MTDTPQKSNERLFLEKDLEMGDYIAAYKNCVAQGKTLNEAVEALIKVLFIAGARKKSNEVSAEDKAELVATLLLEYGQCIDGIKGKLSYSDYQEQHKKILVEIYDKYILQPSTQATKDLQKDLDLAISEIVKLQMNQITQ